jgi:hypothetical protein
VRDEHRGQGILASVVAADILVAVGEAIDAIMAEFAMT